MLAGVLLLSLALVSAMLTFLSLILNFQITSKQKSWSTLSLAIEASGQGRLERCSYRSPPLLDGGTRYLPQFWPRIEENEIPELRVDGMEELLEVRHAPAVDLD